jgi:hypothetical protein
MGGSGIDSFFAGYCLVVDCCEHGNEHLGSIKLGNI